MAVTTAVVLPGTRTILRPMDERDGSALEILCQECADFTLEITGLPPGPAEAQSIFLGLPPRGDYARKRLWGVLQEERLVGVVDAYLGHPDESHFWIGLFMLHPAVRRVGVGTAVIGWVRDYASENRAQAMSLAVKSDYAAGREFWAAQHFYNVRTVELEMSGYGPTMFDIMERPLAR